jgi:hypothetical protein
MRCARCCQGSYRPKLCDGLAGRAPCWRTTRSLEERQHGQLEGCSAFAVRALLVRPHRRQLQPVAAHRFPCTIEAGRITGIQLTRRDPCCRNGADERFDQSADHKRPRRRRQERRSTGRQGDSPLNAGLANRERENGCGNDDPMETQKRFPQGLGNLAQNARFPHSRKPSPHPSYPKEKRTQRLTESDLVLRFNRPQDRRSLGHIQDRQE